MAVVRTIAGPLTIVARSPTELDELATADGVTRLTSSVEFHLQKAG